MEGCWVAGCGPPHALPLMRTLHACAKPLGHCASGTRHLPMLYARQTLFPPGSVLVKRPWPFGFHLLWVAVFLGAGFGLGLPLRFLPCPWPVDPLLPPLSVEALAPPPRGGV